jgi:hypothetical protein
LGAPPIRFASWIVQVLQKRFSSRSLVNVRGVILGMAAATNDARIVFVAGLLPSTFPFAIGKYMARVTTGHPGRSGMKIALIGTLTAVVGILLAVPPGSLSALPTQMR